VPTIRLSNAKTRWGTCHPDGRVHLNWRLIQMPPALIDYVVVHELAHLHEPNHSQRFWRRVAAVLPDYAQRRLALRRDGHRYLLA
jgi:predicted metal-dependent hydrolase